VHDVAETDDICEKKTIEKNDKKNILRIEFYFLKNFSNKSLINNSRITPKTSIARSCESCNSIDDNETNQSDR